jgi:hypothetical protein
VTDKLQQELRVRLVLAVSGKRDENTKLKYYMATQVSTELSQELWKKVGQWQASNNSM